MLWLVGDKMTARLQKLLESVFNPFGFFALERHHEYLKDGGLNRALMRRSPTGSKTEFEAHGSLFLSTNATRNCWSGNRRFKLENGKHSHFQRPLMSKKRSFWRIKESRNTSWICFNGGTGCSPRGCSQSPSQTGIMAVENMAEVPKKYGKLCGIVGRGSTGVVFLSHKVQEWHPSIDCYYAIKVFRRGTRTSETAYQRRIEAEFSISSSLRHQNVVRKFDLLRIGIDSLCECLEYCSGGDLHSLVVVTGQLEQVEADCFFKQPMCGVNYIHEMGIAHRDLKPENLLLTPSGCLKISDFGGAECFRHAGESDIHISRTRRHSRPYVSAEQYLNREFDPRSGDIWAAATW